MDVFTSKGTIMREVTRKLIICINLCVLLFDLPKDGEKILREIWTIVR